ncbi:TPR repeat containing exported protein; Putative periplasmic protein contains a protein prenylyltransferase domain [Helicobacter heilmannii]|uniref:tetratricopeptide repeat protein n=1 Tax=Helicobacter heilmannii TaxID=35817 RepID=UPI0006A02784|nr:tetratricopeptide repeat protein [Helicobacter heilmannii]CRF47869.1 TPR repeat containing exported protein; Putative periplasmic protein contains a protein prenylyltransferase domain [Helicobacter heilmannii]
MKIERVEQRGTKVYAYDENGEELFKKSGELVRYTSSSVYVRRGNKVCKLDAYGYVVDPDVKDEGGSGCMNVVLGVVGVVCVVFYLTFCSSGKSSKNHHTTQEQSFSKEYDKRANIFHDAMELFTAQNYKQAKERFEWLAQIKYRPAFSSYMAGQCAYKEEHYQEAIKFYEQSLKIKEQATYTDILLENLANAYKALKDEKNYTHYKHLLDQQKTGGQ